MPLSTHPTLHAVAWLSAAFLVTSCSSSDSRAQAALGAYQSAAAANDLSGARRALLQLVQAKDDVGDYWVELGKLQASMGSYNDAYYAFTRAYELDRSNPALVRALTELALRSGDLGMAQAHAQELEILTPDDPWVKLTKGWTAISESRFEEALAVGDKMLAATPFDPAATVLKARALVGLGRKDEATNLLVTQVRTQPSDQGSLEILARIYQRDEKWPQLAQVTERLAGLNPIDQKFPLLFIEAALRSGNIPQARKASFKLLQPRADPALITAVLDLWARYWPSPQRLGDARALANAAAGQGQKLAYAAFLNSAGDPAGAGRLASAAATLPVTSASAEANAVLADALARAGNVGGAKARFDAVLAFDPGNATALRGRSELELRTGNTAAAIEDAQKLVTVLRDSTNDRLLLARAFSAAGKGAWADRTLWSAFQDIPADEKIFAALQSRRSGNADAVSELRAEFERQRDAKLNRGLL
jgi:predicted Zn-dependent protease